MQTILNAVALYSRAVYHTLGNRRLDERYSISGTVKASWKSRYGQLISQTCKGLNLSVSGIAIESDEPAAVAADAYLYSSTHCVKCFAVVRYCRRLDAGYQIGLQFQREPKNWDGF